MEDDEEAPIRGISVDVYYIDHTLRGWSLSPAQLYSNNPDDFEFKLSSIATPFDSLDAMAAHIRETADVAFPTVHGKFGEDGGLQRVLENAGVEYVGSQADACAIAFNKRSAALRLGQQGFPVLAQTVIRAADFIGEELRVRCVLTCSHLFVFKIGSFWDAIIMQICTFGLFG